MKHVKVRYNNQEIIVTYAELENIMIDGFLDLDFNGHYLVQFQRDIDNMFYTTGNGINGLGDVIEVEYTTFSADLEQKNTKNKWD